MVVGGFPNRDCWRRCTSNSSWIAVANRSYERIAIVEQAMSFYGAAMDSGDFGYCKIATGK
jgi:hypothetical protein